MSRQTIDYGIDLGTTNSEIACLNGTDIDVIRNAEGSEFTPSAVWIDKQGKVVSGRIAKEWHERDPENAFTEFKRDMGTHVSYTFARSGRQMKPEELSSEVLKLLRADVERRTGESINAAVITVPADFDLPQCEATKRAGELAGFQHLLLLQEPVAAAQAYGFERNEDKTFWLVYDFGGGTFDAAVIQVRDGLIQVVGHGGDNQLGGKNIDWAIVEQLFIPALLREHALPNFSRQNAKCRGAIAKLKIQAEAAKMRLSSTESTEVFIDFLCNDGQGAPIEFGFELQRSELERLAAPFVRRSVNICKETLLSGRLSPADIAKVILVGGPTHMPFLREQLKDAVDGLGIPLEFNVDPLTIVARGAAVFAGSQRLPDIGWNRVESGKFGIKLDYEPVGPEIDPPVAGTLSAGEGVQKDFSGYTVEFINPDIIPSWRSGRIGLGPKGNFMTTVSAEKNKANKFQIELRDATGAIQEVEPKSFQITVKGAGTVQLTLPHAVGVALANNEVKVFFEKGTVLPAKRTNKDLHTAVALSRGQSGELLRVPVMEGNKSRADRNRVAGTLQIPGDRITRDLPAGSGIEVTIEIDQSRLIRVTAFIPVLDQDFDDVMPLESTIPDSKQMSERLTAAKERLRSTREKTDQTGDDKARKLISEIDGQCLVAEAERLVSIPDEAGRCQACLLSIESALDDAEDAMEWPALVQEAENELKEAQRQFEICKPWDDAGKSELAGYRQDFKDLERETREAIAHRIPDLLRRRIAAVDSLKYDVKMLDPGWWLGLFENLKESRGEMTDQALANRCCEQGDRAIQNNDFNGIKAAVRGLIGLLPKNSTSRSAFSDVTV